MLTVKCGYHGCMWQKSIAVIQNLTITENNNPLYDLIKANCSSLDELILSGELIAHQHHSHGFRLIDTAIWER